MAHFLASTLAANQRQKIIGTAFCIHVPCFPNIFAHTQKCAQVHVYCKVKPLPEIFCADVTEQVGTWMDDSVALARQPDGTLATRFIVKRLLIYSRWHHTLVRPKLMRAQLYYLTSLLLRGGEVLLKWIKGSGIFFGLNIKKEILCEHVGEVTWFHGIVIFFSTTVKVKSEHPFPFSSWKPLLHHPSIHQSPPPLLIPCCRLINKTTLLC